MAADTLLGVGARTVKVRGLGALYNEISETVEMNGTASVLLQNEFLRINRIEVITAGSSESNDGRIICEHVAGALTLAIIVIQEGRSHQAIYTVPDDTVERAWLAQIVGSITSPAANGLIEFILQVRPFGLAWQSTVKYAMHSYAGMQAVSLPAWPLLRKKDDIRVRAVHMELNNMSCMAGFQIVYMPRSVKC